jgi:hypothetical protein
MANLNLTPAEQNIVKYHRRSIETGNVGRDEKGRPITVYSSTIYIPEGKYKGKFATVPGWVNNKVIKNEDELYKTWKSDIDKGNWPIYDSGPLGGKRAGEIHQIMDDEEKQARDVMKRQREMKRPLLNNMGIE